MIIFLSGSWTNQTAEFQTLTTEFGRVDNDVVPCRLEKRNIASVERNLVLTTTSIKPMYGVQLVQQWSKKLKVALQFTPKLINQSPQRTTIVCTIEEKKEEI